MALRAPDAPDRASTIPASPPNTNPTPVCTTIFSNPFCIAAGTNRSDGVGTTSSTATVSSLEDFEDIFTVFIRATLLDDVLNLRSDIPRRRESLIYTNLSFLLLSRRLYHVQ